MKNILILFMFIRVFTFSDIIDDDNFLSQENHKKINTLVLEVKKEKDLDIDIILVNSKIIIDKNSFYNKKKSIFLILTHDNNYIQNIDVFLSSDIRVKTEEQKKIIEISKNFMRLNHHLDSEPFIIELINIFKNFNFQNNLSLFYFLKGNLDFSLVSLLFILVALVKIFTNFNFIKKLKFRKNKIT